jgi:cytochrome b
MQKILVWDLPLRLFHWLLAVAFGGAFLIATTADDDGPLFPLHAIFGATAAFLIVLRIVWGLIGTRHARFASFPLHPRRLMRYLRSTLGGGDRNDHVGHNPATSLFALFLLATVLGLGVTGISLGLGGEAAEEIHEVLAWIGAALVAVHLTGIAWDTVRRRENVAAQMISGHRAGEPGDAIASHRFGTAVVLLVLTVAWSASLMRGYDSAARTLHLPGTGLTLTIGEVEDAHDREEAGIEEDDDDD